MELAGVRAKGLAVAVTRPGHHTKLVVRANRPSAHAAVLVAMTQDGTQWLIPLTSRLRKRFGDNTALHFYASLRADDSLKLGNIAPYQGW